MKCTSLIVRIGAVCWLVTPTVCQDSGSSNRLEATVQAFVRASSFQGSILVADAEGIRLRASYGESDKARNLSNTSGTRFCLASLSKQFTAAAVLKLCDEGRLRLDAPLVEYLPELTGSIGADATLHHLMTHTAGLPWGIEALGSEGPADAVSLAEIVRLVGATKPDTVPGERFHYSDLGYVLCAAVLEGVSGKTYGALLSELFFEPLGMSNTLDSSAMSPETEHALGYVWRDGQPAHAVPENKSYATGAGSLWSTAEDLLRWGRAVHSGGVLGEESHQLWLRAKVQDYAYGWRTFEYGPEGARGHGVGHTGRSRDGYSCAMRCYLGDGLTVIVLGNLDFTGKAELLQRIEDVLLPATGPATP